MKKEILEVKDGILRVTTLDERWYAKESADAKGLPVYKYVPSSSWIADSYPKGVGFYKWLASKGWDEAENIKNFAGNRGTKVHYACSDIDEGKEISIQMKYPNSQGVEEDLTPDEVEAIVSFKDFIDMVQPQLLSNEFTGFGDGYAGTLDKIYRIPKAIKNLCQKGIYIVDLKTSANIWASHELQIASYSHMKIPYAEMGITEKEWEDRRLAILQVGYTRNKAKWKFTEVPDKYKLFRHAYAIWQNENPDAKPKQRDFPLVIKSEFRAKEEDNVSTKTE